MLEKLFFVFLGWWLSEFAKVFSSTDQAKRRNSTMLLALKCEIDRLCTCGIPATLPLSPWWETVRLEYYKYLPAEALAFDKALMVIKTSSSKAEKCTNELTNLAKLLNKSELYWQQSIYRLFLLRAKSTLQL